MLHIALVVHCAPAHLMMMVTMPLTTHLYSPESPGARLVMTRP